MEALCAGSFMIDIVAPHLPSITPPGGLIYAPEGISVNVGGHAANVSIDLAQLGQTKVAAAGCIGDDILGRFIQETLTNAGVEPLPQILTDIHTAKNIALTVEGEDRRFIAELAANTLLSPNHIINLLKKHPRILYLGTIGGLRHVDSDLPRILAAAKAIDAVTLVDVIAPTKPNWDHLIRALPGIDMLHLNDTEALLATGFKDPLRATKKLRSLGAKTIVLTSASSGLIALHEGSIIKMPAFEVKAIDETGAGDALCAGLIHSLLNLKSPSEASLAEFKFALLFGQAAGAACVTAPGATTAVTAKNVKQLIKEQGEKILASSL